MTRTYRLLAPDGRLYESAEPGTLGGNRGMRIYGALTCWSARAAIPRGYAAQRVFFADEAAAIAAGYRPCGHCMRKRYAEWKQGPQPDNPYPWRTGPKAARAGG